MERPKLSIIMSVYNEEKYLREAMDSILNQTFRDFEFLIINDCSTDSSREIILSYPDPRIRLIDNTVNIGLTCSLIKGLQLAAGEYIARQDADDISLPRRLEKQINFLHQNATVGLVGTSPIVINEEGKCLFVIPVLTGIKELKKELENGNQFTHGSVVFRKKCIEQVGSYRKEFKVAQDYDLWLRLSKFFNLANISEPLYKWRLDINSISGKQRISQDQYAAIAIKLHKERQLSGVDALQRNDIHKIKQFFKPLTDRVNKDDKSQLIKSYNYWGKYLLVNDQPKEAMRFFCRSFQYGRFSLQIWFFLLLTKISLISSRLGQSVSFILILLVNIRKKFRNHR